MEKKLVQNAIGLTLALLAAVPVMAQLPDHPIITEVFNNATGNDGPTGHNPANTNQEFIEILLPTLANLSPALNKDALNLTYYEIEGDSNSLHLGWVNQRFDLPTFDLDPSNGVTPGSVARPTSGLVVLGWVDYNALDPPTALAGTPSTRIGLINHGITVSPAGVTFIAINGAQFGGTTNFEVPTLESRIDIPNEHISGVMKNGSNAYLLVNRDDPGFAALVDHSAGVPTDAGLPGGLILGLTSLLDGFAGNDDLSFVESLQPFAASSLIDLATVLPIGGVFTPWVAQIAEGPGTGYARQYVDVPRTTEDGIPGNEDPALDAVTNYRNVFRTGPFFPTPGAVTLSTAPPELGVSLPNRLQFQILSNTTGRPGLLCANTGGNFPIDVALTLGASDNPSVVSFVVQSPALAIPGQQEGLPQISAAAAADALDGTIVSAPVTFSATNTVVGDPAVLNPVQGSTTSAVVLKPTKGIDALGLPIETTVFAAVQGFGADAAVLNEFLGTDLATFVAANLGTDAGETLGNLATLLNPATNLEDFATVDLLRQPFPSTFINAAGAPGTDDLVTTLLTSAKVASGSTAYAGSISTAPSGLKAIAFAIPETFTRDGSFSPGEQLFFADATGAVNLPRSGLNSVTTDRTFELALIDTNVTSVSIESGDSDDFGIIVKAGQVTPTASVASGEFVFLSLTGGLEGEDIDTLDVPGVNATVAILLDLDNLHDVLGVESITQVYVVDAGLGGTLNVMEVLSLNTSVPTAPIVTGIGNFSVDEGTILDRQVASFTDPSDTGPHTATIDWGDGTVEPGVVDPFATPTPSVSGTHAYGDNGVYTVTVTVIDSGLLQGLTTFSVTANNTPPQVSAGPARVATTGETLELASEEFVIMTNTEGVLSPVVVPPVAGSATFADLGFDVAAGVLSTLEDFTASVDWGDGTVQTTGGGGAVLSESPGGPGVPTTGTISVSHAYASAGQFDLCVTVTDDDGGQTVACAPVTVTGVPIPTISQWGIVVMAMLILASGTVLFRRGKQRGTRALRGHML